MGFHIETFHLENSWVRVSSSIIQYKGCILSFHSEMLRHTSDNEMFECFVTNVFLFQEGNIRGSVDGCCTCDGFEGGGADEQGDEEEGKFFEHERIRAKFEGPRAKCCTLKNCV